MEDVLGHNRPPLCLPLLNEGSGLKFVVSFRVEILEFLRGMLAEAIGAVKVK